MAPVAAVGLLADAISLVGLVGVFAWIAWRFGPTLLRIAGWSGWWVAWACGGQGGYGYCVAFLVLGTVSWVAGTVWYARRRGRWPSTLSGRLLARLPGASAAIPHGEPHTDVGGRLVRDSATEIAPSSHGSHHVSGSSRAFSDGLGRPGAPSSGPGAPTGGPTEDPTMRAWRLAGPPPAGSTRAHRREPRV
jgi:hypothetical protein